MLPQLLHSPMLNQRLLSQLRSPVQIYTAGHGEDGVTAAQLIAEQ